jgi:hypothetical protein
MLSFDVTLDVVAASLANILRDALPGELRPLVDDNRYDFRCNVVVQALAGNTGTVMIGGSDRQDGFVLAGNGASFDRLDMNHFFIRSTVAGDRIAVLLNM